MAKSYKGIHNVLYILSCNDKKFFKIGVCKEGTLERRVKTLQTGNPYKITVEYHDIRHNATKAETFLHQQLSSYCESGEWFTNITLEDIRIKLFFFFDQS